MAKKAKKDASQGSIMEQLAAYSPPWEEPAEEKKEDPNAGLAERLGKLETMLEAQRQQQVYNNFQSHPVAQQTAAAQKTVANQGEVNLENMPDPVTHTKEYSAELIKRVNAANDAKIAALAAEQRVEREREQLSNNLWTGFKTARPDWAGHEMLVEAAAGRVSQALQQQGVDVVSLVKARPDVFYNEVGNLLDKQYPQLKKDGGEGDDQPTSGANNDQAVVFGGTPGRKSAAEAAHNEEDDNVAWLREVTTMQHKLGLK